MTRLARDGSSLTDRLGFPSMRNVVSVTDAVEQRTSPCPDSDDRTVHEGEAVPNVSQSASLKGARLTSAV